MHTFYIIYPAIYWYIFNAILKNEDLDFMSGKEMQETSGRL